MKREFLMLASKCEEEARIGGFYASEKLNGVLGYWDGGITRGLRVEDVPFANVGKTGAGRVATGLWSRYGKPYSAPEWFLDKLPPCPLAGELYIGRGKFQETLSAVRKYVPVDSEWQPVKLHAFDIPPHPAQWIPGRIHCREWRVEWGEEIGKWVPQRIKKVPQIGGMSLEPYFHNVIKELGQLSAFTSMVQVRQELLPVTTDAGARRARVMFEEVLSGGGEGLILRHPSSHWLPIRSKDYLKMKPKYEGEGTLVGVITGKETNDGSRNLGKIGSLLVLWRGIVVGVGGLTDEERELPPEGREWAERHPDEALPEHLMHQSKGTLIAFTYLELSKDGVPKSANISRGVE